MDFITVFSFIVFLVLVPLTVMGVSWLGGRAGELIQAKVDNEYLRSALLRLDDAVVTAVKDLQQTLAKEFRALSADGKLSREDRRRLKDTAVRHVKSYLGPTGLKDLAKVLGLWELSIEDFIGSKVEAAVHDMKRGDDRPPTRAPARAEEAAS